MLPKQTPPSSKMVDSLTTSPCPLDQPEPKLNIRISMFMDGTGNNMYNTDKRKEGTHAGEGDDSYSADYSNVVRLHLTLQTPSSGEDYHIKIYTEGIGTKEGKSDSTVLGKGLAMGDYGIESRVTECFQEISNRIQEHAGDRKRIDRLRIDCFGFSRGAAAARNLIHVLLHGAPDLVAFLQAIGISVAKFEIPFVGLFDTVSSHGVVHTNDTKDLHLDSIKNPIVEKVVQFAAGDEHRVNFALTNIASAGARGLEIYIPGAHSDIGGGYIDGSDEVAYPLLPPEETGEALATAGSAFKSYRNELINLGWYDESELSITNEPFEISVERGYRAKFTRSWLMANRKGISNRYSYIPLHMMGEKASEKQLKFDLSGYDYSTDPRLAALRPLLDGNRHNGDYWIQYRDPVIRALRHDYFHYSAHVSSPIQVIEPHEPQFYSAAGGWTKSWHASIRRRRVMEG